MNAQRWIGLMVAMWLASGCNKGGSGPPTEAPTEAEAILAYAAPGMSGCDHETETIALAKHAWPYPAEARDVAWGDKYRKMKLKLKPNAAAFFTATVTWKKGERIEVLDSEIVIRKPRQVVAKHDMMVTRKVWDQGIEVQRTEKAVAAGDVASFLFYNSRGLCLIQTKHGPAWTKCALGTSFEGVTEAEPFACEQTWWIKVRKSKIDQGWMPFEQDFMNRIPSADAEAR